MVGHEAVSENLDGLLLTVADEEVEVAEAVAVGEENVLAWAGKLAGANRGCRAIAKVVRAGREISQEKSDPPPSGPSFPAVFRRTTKTDAQPVTTLLAAQRLRARNARAARKAKVVEITKDAVA